MRATPDVLAALTREWQTAPSAAVATVLAATVQSARRRMVRSDLDGVELRDLTATLIACHGAVRRTAPDELVIATWQTANLGMAVLEHRLRAPAPKPRRRKRRKPTAMKLSAAVALLERAAVPTVGEHPEPTAVETAELDLARATVRLRLARGEVRGDGRRAKLARLVAPDTPAGREVC